MSVFITGAGNISVQPTVTTDGFPEPVYHGERYARCIEPSWADFIPPMEARRMSPIIKRAIVSTRIAIDQSGTDVPDAIITGTGLGCIEDTEKFLTSMIQENEKFLKPTYFIHSTHNTISSQIAIRLGCNGYNNTFVHRGISFELALQDAFLLFMQKKINTALVGGHDEMTPAYFGLLDRTGYWKKEDMVSSSLCNSDSPGSIAGEGSITFALSGSKTPSAYAEIKGIETFYNGSGTTDINGKINGFLESHNLLPSDIEMVMMGINGDVSDNSVYYQVAENLFKESMLCWYKHLSLEYFTAPAFGLWASAMCLKNESVPGYLVLKGDAKGKVKNILLYNHFRNRNHSLVLLSSC